MLAQQPQVQRRAVTLVLIEGILRILLVQAQQVRVAGGLGQDGRGEIAGTRASPLITVCTVQPSLGAWLPSTSASCGATDRPCTARCIANMVARRMFRLSISWTLALAMNQASARSRISSASASRRAGLSALESARPSIGRAGSRITAAA